MPLYPGVSDWINAAVERAEDPASIPKYGEEYDPFYNDPANPLRVPTISGKKKTDPPNFFDTWLGLPNVFELFIISKGIAVNPDALIDLILRIGNIEAISNIDDDKLHVIRDDVQWIPLIKFKIFGNQLRFPWAGSKRFTNDGTDTTVPRIALNVAIIFILLGLTFYLGPDVLKKVKDAFPQLANLVMSVNSSLKQKEWKATVMSEFDYANKVSEARRDSVLEDAAENTQEIKDYIDTKVYVPWF